MTFDYREAFRAAVWTAGAGLLALIVVGATWARAENCVASYYTGGGTACGDRYVQPMSAAYKSLSGRYLPCGTRLRVTAPSTGRSIVVTVRDHGPFVAGRCVDLSRDAAQALGIIEAGKARVTVEQVQ